MSAYLFTYGTLQAEESLGFLEKHHLTEQLVSQGRHIITGDLLHLHNHEHNLHYPGLINHNQTSNLVHGTVFEVLEPTTVFTVMDDWEGFDPTLTAADSAQQNFYERVAIQIPGCTNESVWVYALNEHSAYYQSDIVETCGPVPQGDWLNFQSTLS